MTDHAAATALAPPNPPLSDSMSVLQSDVLAHGPLPVGWTALAVANLVKYKHVDDDEVYDWHPCSEAFSLHAPAFAFKTSEESDGVFGMLPPRRAGVQDFVWSPPGNWIEAIAASLHSLLSGIGGERTASCREVAKAATELTSKALPFELYDPSDRQADAGQRTRAQKEEQEMARLARHYYTSLVIVDTGVGDWNEYLSTQSGAPAARIRWSYGADYELFPPVYVGRAMGQWRGLTLKKPAAISYASWDATLHDWYDKAKELQAIGFPLSGEGFIRVATLVQRAIRAGILPENEACLSHTIISAAIAMQRGRTFFAFLRGYTSMQSSMPTLITFGWITEAIATFSSTSAYQFARTWDFIAHQYDRNQRDLPNEYSRDVWNELDVKAGRFGIGGPARTFPEDNYVPLVPNNISRHAMVPRPRANGASRIFGSIDTSSSVRVSLGTTTNLPMVNISIRKNHFVGNQLNQNMERYKKDAKVQAPSTTKHGLDARQFANDHLEERLMIDLDCVKDMHIVKSSKTKVTIFIDLVDGATPTRHRMTGVSFPKGSDEDAALALAKSSWSFEIRLDFKNPVWAAAFETWQTLVGLRETTPSGPPSNEWYLARKCNDFVPDGGAGRLNLFINDVIMPTSPWLVHTTDPGTLPAMALAMPRMGGPPIDMLPSIQAYETMFFKAVLYEQMDGQRRHAEQYNGKTSYPARFRTGTEPGACTIDIRMAPSVPFARGTTIIIPEEGTTVTVRVEGSDIDIEGVAEEAIEEAYHFRLSAKLPSDNPPRVHIDEDERNVQVTLRCEFTDVASNQRSVAIRVASERARLAPVLKDGEKYPHPQFPDTTCGPLLLHNIMLDQKEDVSSPPLVSFFERGDSSNRAVVIKMMQGIRSRAGLDADQTAVFNAVFHGVPANILLVEGVPGSGKSTCQAWIIAGIACLQGKTLITSQSNTGVNALFDKTVKVMGRDPALQHLQSRCVRLRTTRTTMREMKEIAIGARSEADVGRFSMASVASRRAKTGDPTVFTKSYKVYVEAWGKGEKPATKYSWKEVVIGLSTDVLATALVVGATSAMVGRLEHMDWSADIAVFDEASQATEPDLLVVATRQQSLQLLVVVGDTRQLGPVVPSESAKQNPYGNFLSTSALAWLIRRNPHLCHITLWTNYRSVRSLVDMPSRLFYDEKMKAGRGMDSTAVTDRVQAFVRSIRGASDVASPDSRQYFIDVDSRDRKGEVTGSRTNFHGCEAIVDYSLRLVHKHEILQDSIGVISMYADDIKHLKTSLKRAGLEGIKASTVDGFQGEEKDIIMLHIVASQEFAFISNPNRMNVGTTRAKDFMFIFGNYSSMKEFVTVKVTGLKEEDKKRYTTIIGMVDHIRKNGQSVAYRKARTG